MRLKIAYNFFIVLCAIGMGSCTKQNPVPSLENTSSNKEVSQEIVPIESTTKMVEITGGKYMPFYSADDSLVFVASFLMDETPVTNQDFLEFVKANPAWRKSNIKKIYTDSTYLRDWVSDTVLPKGSNPNAPVCFVSWFAAKAYAKAVGKRLPTMDEWEYVAMADETEPNARGKSSYSNNILNSYLIKDRQFKAIKQSKPNYWGVYNMFDLVWEWTDDFNSIMVSGESRDGGNGDKNLVCAAGATNATDVMNYSAFMRFGLRTSLKANYTVANLGFRCVKEIEK